MEERKEVQQKFGVIFAIWDGKNICLEDRIEPGHRLTGYIIIPGGGIEEGENEEETLLREMREEYGVEATEYKNIGHVTYRLTEDVENNGSVYLVTAWEGNLSNPENRNIHLQVPLSEARDLCELQPSQKKY
jgi:8-oxo-dGTP pyrophosphatase MutT (NUDIX family)